MFIQQKLDKLKESKQLAMDSPKKEIQSTLKSPAVTPPKPDPVLSSPEPAYGKVIFFLVMNKIF
jgi:hypothetical protein